jgi:hypothetical protein
MLRYYQAEINFYLTRSTSNYEMCRIDGSLARRPVLPVHTLYRITPFCGILSLGSTEPLTEMSMRNIPRG